MYQRINSQFWRLVFLFMFLPYFVVIKNNILCFHGKPTLVIYHKHSVQAKGFCSNPLTVGG